VSRRQLFETMLPRYVIIIIIIIIIIAATKQSTWDRTVTALERQVVISSLSDATDKARLHAVSSPHSSDWLHTHHCLAAVCDFTTVLSTSLLVFNWVPTYANLTSALAERLLTQENCMVCRAEGATIDTQGITT